ncbi:DUF2817 domain-containing protein [Candidatus Saccharibacteria bacterium]|nr:MAG: DUF2817 domain-containing protein [Candidatus Saccharibacteria bacterium]
MRAWRWYRSWPFIRQILLASGAFLIFVVISALARPVQFSYAGGNCYNGAVILPQLQKSSDSGYALHYTDLLQIGDVVLSASTVCVSPASAPQPHTTATIKSSLFGVPLLGQYAFSVAIPETPAVNYHVINDGVAATRPLTIPLNVTDRTFVYQLRAESKTAACKPQEKAISCDIEALGLKQGTKYQLALIRQFNGQTVKTLTDQDVTTLSPVSVVESSVKPNEAVYAKPTSVTFKMDKSITSATAKLERIEGDKRTAVEQSAKVKDQSIEVHFAELPRSSQYQLTLTEVIAEDGSSLLDKTYALAFSMSGGPKVTGVNIGRFGVAVGATVVVTFDQNLSPSQDISSLVKLAGGAGNLSRSGNQIRFSTASVPLCGDFSVVLGKEIQSEHGISGDSAWNYTSRTICHTVSTIGYSAKGRAITAYTFGSGSQTILYVGAIHGNERATYLLMSEWIDELESKARSIPADKTIVVIPAVNRDGLAAGSRRNANNVDLNRNFPTADWKKDVTMPGGEAVAGGGGSKPLSELESVALANYTRSLSPRLVLTYHSVGWLVTPNEAGISSSYASTYSRLSGYYVSPKSAASTTFEYDTTGAYEDWLYEGPGIATILVELGSHTSSQSGRNFLAMWTMMK